MKKLLSILVFIICFTTTFANQQEQAEMADVMRSNGKIYVVVGVILIVLGGLIAYLVSIERKVKKLEQKIDDEK